MAQKIGKVEMYRVDRNDVIVQYEELKDYINRQMRSYDGYYDDLNPWECFAKIHEYETELRFALAISWTPEDKDFIDIYMKMAEELRRKVFKVMVREVIFNGPATIVYWWNGDKTVVKAREGEPFDGEKGIFAAMAKKLFDDDGYYAQVAAEADPPSEIMRMAGDLYYYKNFCELLERDSKSADEWRRKYDDLVYRYNDLLVENERLERRIEELR